uniref:Uncharacterized protein n=1 Tax=Romanomermis culicivorax TaxID=13658 RepID=A0A915J9U4_ROMCU
MTRRNLIPSLENCRAFIQFLRVVFSGDLCSKMLNPHTMKDDMTNQLDFANDAGLKDRYFFQFDSKCDDAQRVQSCMFL